MTEEPVFPLFVFVRHRDIEIETGFILAGNLIVDIELAALRIVEQRRQLEPGQEQMIREIIDRLYAAVRSGRMGDDVLVCGWPGGVKPANAVDVVCDDARMQAWEEGRVKIAVRVGDDGNVRVDSGSAWKPGLMREH